MSKRRKKEQIQDDGDTYFTLKQSLGKICPNLNLLEKIQEVVINVDEIITRTYEVLNLHILRLIQNSLLIPDIDQSFITKIINAVTYPEQTRKSPNIDLEVQKTMEWFLPENHNNNNKKISRKGLTFILQYAAIEVVTAVKNNIQMHFYQRQLNYLKTTSTNKSIEELKEEQKMINENKQHLTLPKIVANVGFDLKSHPEKFLYPMFNMNRYFEVNGHKLFSLLPMRRGFIPRYITITSDCLYQIISTIEDDEINITKHVKDGTISTKDIWGILFHIKKLNGKEFDFHIKTNGIAASILYKNKSKKKNNKNKR